MASNSQPEDVRPRIIPLDLPVPVNLRKQENIVLYQLFQHYGYELRVAGDEVWKALLGVPSNFVNFVTSATIAQLNTMFQLNNNPAIRSVKEAHGTFAVLFCNEAKLKITVLQMNTVPSGSQVGLSFIDGWHLHSATFPFTVSSMTVGVESTILQAPSGRSNIASLQWRVYDYHGGYEDLMHRRVRFIGDPSTRIREDHLRILQYFRLQGNLSRPGEYDNHDPSILKAISENVSGLANIAGDLCWSELKEILCYQSTPSLLRRMLEVGVLPYLGFPDAPDFTEMDSAWERGILSRDPDPVTCLATLVSDDDQVDKLHSRLKLSMLELKIITYIVSNRGPFAEFSETEVMQLFRHELLLNHATHDDVRRMIGETMKYLVFDSNLITQVNEMSSPRFPIIRKDVELTWSISRTVARSYMPILRQQWVDSDGTWDRRKLLSGANRTIVERIISERQRQQELNDFVEEFLS